MIWLTDKPASRYERHIIRQRGAGARQLQGTAISFGFGDATHSPERLTLTIPGNASCEGVPQEEHNQVITQEATLGQDEENRGVSTCEVTKIEVKRRGRPKKTSQKTSGQKTSRVGESSVTAQRTTRRNDANLHKLTENGVANRINPHLPDQVDDIAPTRPAKRRKRELPNVSGDANHAPAVCGRPRGRPRKDKVEKVTVSDRQAKDQGQSPEHQQPPLLLNTELNIAPPSGYGIGNNLALQDQDSEEKHISKRVLAPDDILEHRVSSSDVDNKPVLKTEAPLSSRKRKGRPPKSMLRNPSKPTASLNNATETLKDFTRRRTSLNSVPAGEGKRVSGNAIYTDLQPRPHRGGARNLAGRTELLQDTKSSTRRSARQRGKNKAQEQDAIEQDVEELCGGYNDADVLKDRPTVIIAPGKNYQQSQTADLNKSVTNTANTFTADVPPINLEKDQSRPPAAVTQQSPESRSENVIKLQKPNRQPLAAISPNPRLPRVRTYQRPTRQIRLFSEAKRDRTTTGMHNEGQSTFWEKQDWFDVKVPKKLRL